MSTRSEHSGSEHRLTPEAYTNVGTGTWPRASRATVRSSRSIRAYRSAYPDTFGCIEGARRYPLAVA
jgi:hypothetical protein